MATDAEDVKATSDRRRWKTSSATTAARRGTTLTSVLNPSAVTPKEADAAAASAAAAAAAAVARNRDPTSRRTRPDGARGASGTQERVNLAVQTSLAGRQT